MVSLQGKCNSNFKMPEEPGRKKAKEPLSSSAIVGSNLFRGQEGRRRQDRDLQELTAHFLRVSAENL